MLRLTIRNEHQQREIEHAAGPLEFGRIARRGLPRVVLDDPHVSRDQMRIRQRSGGRLELENLSTRTTIELGDGSTIGCSERRELKLPVQVIVGTTSVEIASADSPGPADSWQTIMMPRAEIAADERQWNLNEISGTVTPEMLAHWFETVIAVQRSAAGSAEFFQETARAVVELVGLDRGMVLLRRRGNGHDGEWQVAADVSLNEAKNEFSRTVLERVVAERRTFYRSSEAVNATNSLVNVEAVVASPVLDPAGQVVGAVYGSRSCGGAKQGPAIRALEAQLVQLLAAAVGSGLARQQHEAEAARGRVQFEQFFSSALARELERDPALLDGSDREVTVLFSDIRNFTSLSEQLGPAETCRLVGDVMEQMTVRIGDRAGVLVDYVGDGLLAMWNAPTDQPDHAIRAAWAALEMFDELPALNDRWRQALGRSLAIGVGLNTGTARVGNTGSRRRFKYGPLGHTVNLGSRVESATRHLGVPILVTDSTHAQLKDQFATRRLCRAKLQGVQEPVELYELARPDVDESWLRRRDAYQQGLEHFEAGRWAEACQAVYPLLTEPGVDYDVPSLTLVGRAVECLKSPPVDFDPVWEFSK